MFKHYFSVQTHQLAMQICGEFTRPCVSHLAFPGWWLGSYRAGFVIAMSSFISLSRQVNSAKYNQHVKQMQMCNRLKRRQCYYYYYYYSCKCSYKYWSILTLTRSQGHAHTVTQRDAQEPQTRHESNLVVFRSLEIG